MSYPSSYPSSGSSLSIQRFEIKILDYDRARVFYTEALGFELWPEMNNPPTSCDFLNFRLTYISPPGYFMKLFKKGRAAIFIPATQNLKGYPRKLVVEDLLDTTQRIESAGGEIYRPTRLLRRSEGLQMLLISDQTFFQDTEGNITELCSSTVAPDLSRSRSHISDSFSSDMSLT